MRRTRRPSDMEGWNVAHNAISFILGSAAVALMGMDATGAKAVIVVLLCAVVGLNLIAVIVNRWGPREDD